MKKRKVDPWFPFWIDKWLFGSTRIELEPDERGVFVDLITLSKKDEGYVRANEGVPYLERQLCGYLNIEPELLQRTIKKCIKYGKAEKLKDGTLYMTSHEVYKLTDRHKRRLESEMSEETDTMSGKTDAKKRINKNRINKDNIKNIKTSAPKPTTAKPKPNPKPKAKPKPKISFSFETGKFSNIEKEDAFRWSVTYPACNIEIELLKMEDWLLSNPTKAKSNYRRFITNWLSSQQDKGGTKEWDKDQQRSRNVGMAKPRVKTPKEIEYENLRTVQEAALTKKFRAKFKGEKLELQVKNGLAKFSQEFWKEDK